MRYLTSLLSIIFRAFLLAAVFVIITMLLAAFITVIMSIVFTDVTLLATMPTFEVIRPSMPIIYITICLILSTMYELKGD